MMILQQLELFCSCFHEGGHDPTVPSENLGSAENHLHPPCGKMWRIETLDGKRRRCGGGEIYLGFLPSPKMLYL
jgi:hypothetical protein